MLNTLKKRLYFITSSYFTFWAKFVLRRWNPRVILITGSSGKTTVLSLIEAQLKDKAYYSHNANSAFGISFQLLGLGTNVSSKGEWLIRFISAPFKIRNKPPKQSIYIVEADADRPHEGDFTSKFLRPEVVLWTSVYLTHSANFDQLISANKFKDTIDAIAYEFGNFAVAATKLVLANGDQQILKDQLERVEANVEVKTYSQKDAADYKLTRNGTEFKLDKLEINLVGLHPKEVSVGVQMVKDLSKYLNTNFDPNFKDLNLPAGRSTMLRGKKETVIIDSTYNTGLGATIALIDLFSQYPAKLKWLIIGDILEQGTKEKSEHQELAKVLLKTKVDKIILLGRRNAKYSYPTLKDKLPDKIVSFESPKEVLDYLEKNLKGHEALLFKGAQGLEGVIEQLLASPKDEAKLVRRSMSWKKRRQAWGLPN
jgi:UDP-N-acetylmuramoyl-tripeptide--D-alanyl-D-alanine ligase